METDAEILSHKLEGLSRDVSASTVLNVISGNGHCNTYPGADDLPISMKPSLTWKRNALPSDSGIEFLFRFVLLLFVAAFLNRTERLQAEVTVLDTVVIYEDASFYSAFPSIVRRPDGELLVAFRRAPERRAFGEKGVSHTDPNSYLVLVRSRDNGRTWSKEPQLIYAHPFGGSQDPCMVQLRDGTILCSSYTWSLLDPGAIQKLKQPIARQGNYVFLGGYLVRSQDGGKSWQGPFFPPPARTEENLDIFGSRLPAYNRGAMCEGRHGRIYWAVASSAAQPPHKTSVHLLISEDKGETWKYSAVVAQHETGGFNETSLIETPKGDLVAFLRSENLQDHTWIARSRDGGKTFHAEDAGFRGHPHHALALGNKGVLLVYGYRHQPYGIRGRILDAECTDAATAAEFVLRDDGGNGDLGYPWSTAISDDRVLVVYYFNRSDKTRHIGGTFLEIK